MLYLEDYLELVENLPMEMREKLTEMREMDLQVSNTLDTLDENVKAFFKKCLQANCKKEWKEEQFKKIKEEYYKALEDTDEKVQLANHIYELVDRHSRRLDQELSKFKMELEADNAGITEVLEKRSLELDKPPPGLTNHKSEKRRLTHTQSTVTNHSDKRPATEVLSSLANEVVRESFGPRRPSSASSSPAAKMFSSSGSGSGISYTLGNIGAGNPAIAAAASQAMAATIQMQTGRRTSSMKASYDLMTKNPSVLPKDLSISVSQSVSAPSTPEPVPRSQRTKKQTSKAAALAAAQQQQQQQQQAAAAAAATASQPATPQVSTTESEEVPSDVQVDEWNADPNEPRYCLCNQVSYGDMVGCDNNDCPIEWFHYGCVGLSQAPKGKWYCPQCTAAMKRRGRR
ncbi:inhibitor of growth protein 3 [Aplysia californica]|uniref:Inhibitor of growth protein n=1 Tax=Aplysia californica TaxID=6500 RepID=A0ABM0JSM2_APLCA|nr:inhibitor of growth protein 3 [Aplysia californica]